MTFLSPLFLLGLGAVLLPVAIHLLSKPRLKRTSWAATRFLVASLQKNRSRMQVEDLILLLLRCLLFALLALMFARPAWLVHALGLDVGQGATTAVIVLDNSASMGQSDGTASRFDQAKTMIDGVLSKLAPGSACALDFVSDRVEPIIPKPTKDLAIIRRTLAQLQPSDGGSNLLVGLETAVDTLKAAGAAKGDIYVLTDSQVSAWRELGAIRQLQQNHPSLQFHFLVVGTQGEDNLGVTGMQISGTLLAVNQPILAAVTVSNWSKTPALKVPVKLSIDSDPPLDEGIIPQIDPGASKSITLTARFRQPGYHSLTAVIPGDRLPADNQRSLALQILDQIRILVVEGSPSPDPVTADGFYLKNALLPVRPDQLDAYPVKVTIGATDALESSTLNQYQLVYLSNVARLTPVGAQNVRRYVSQGGALIIFPGPATDATYYNSDPDFSSLLPAKLGRDLDPPGDKKTLGWQSHDYDHPITRLWNDPASGNLGSVQVTHYFPLTPNASASSPAASPQTVLKYADGEPAALEQTFGKGKVFLFSSTATTAWTSLPVQPVFVPFLIRLTTYITSGTTGKLNLAPGEPFGAEVDSDYANKDLFVESPGEKKRLAGRIDAGEQNAFMRYARTGKAGPYRLYVGDDPTPKVVFAVQIDPSESDLAQEPADALAPLMKGDAGDTATATNAANPPLGPLVPGPELWYPLAIATLVLVIGESLFAHFCSQSK